MDVGAVYYAKADGSAITEVAYPMVTPNGIGLSPDGTTLYVAETEAARLWAFPIEAPGVVKKEPWPSPHGGRLVAGMGGYQRFDSLAVQADGRICVATLVNGGITVISPDGRHVEHHPMPDLMTTNICFGGPDMKTAYITLSWTGRLVAVDWPTPGLRPQAQSGWLKRLSAAGSRGLSEGGGAAGGLAAAAFSRSRFDTGCGTQGRSPRL